MRITILILLLFCGVAYGQIKDPLIHYSFDNTLVDSSGNGYTLKTYGDATFDASIKTVGSHSGILDGNNDYWRIPQVNLGNTFFISLWLRSDASITVDKVFMTIADASDYFFLGGGNSNIIYALATGFAYVGDATWTATAWHNLVFAFRKSDSKGRIYLDGTKVGSDSTLVGTFNSNDSLFIGVDYYRNSDWDGNIDEVRIYTGYMPSEAQIDSLYAKTYIEAAGAYSPPQYRPFYNGVEKKPYYNGLLAYMTYTTPNGVVIGGGGYGYDSTYVLSIDQEYYIPENVANSDEVGIWKKNLTWKSGNTIAYSIEDDPLDAFTITRIDNDKARITISDYTKINGKRSSQDTCVHVLIRTTDGGLSYEIDTARIYISENSYDHFLDNVSSGAGTKASPWKDFGDITPTAGHKYWFKRGVIWTNQTMSISTDLASTNTNPMVFGAYGSGDQPVFNGSETGYNDCFSFYTSSGSDFVDYVRFHELKFRYYNGAGIFCWRSRYIDVHGCTFNNMYRKDLDQSVIVYNTYSETFAFQFNDWPITIQNCTFDTTSILLTTSTDPYDGMLEKSYIKIGVGPLYLYNNSFGKMFNSTIGGQPTRITGGRNHDVKHNIIDGQDTRNSLGDVSVQFRGSHSTFTDNRFIANTSGVRMFPSSSNPNGRADTVIFTNNLFKDCTRYGVQITANNDAEPSSDSIVFQDNLFNGCNTGISLRDTKDNVIRRNVFIGGTNTAIEGISSEANDRMWIYYNVMYGFISYPINIQRSLDLKIYNNTIDCTNGIFLSNYTTPLVKNNIFRSSTVDTDDNVDLDGLNTDNYFENYDGHNYMIIYTATDLIDNGTAVSLTPDIQGTTVPQGSATDVGAYEYIP